MTSRLAPTLREIRQDPYVPLRNQADFTPEESVSFSANGSPGFSIARAAAGEFAGLDKRGDGISCFEGNKAIFRIHVGV